MRTLLIGFRVRCRTHDPSVSKWQWVEDRFNLETVAIEHARRLDALGHGVECHRITQEIDERCYQEEFEPINWREKAHGTT